MDTELYLAEIRKQRDHAIEMCAVLQAKLIGAQREIEALKLQISTAQTADTEALLG